MSLSSGSSTLPSEAQNPNWTVVPVILDSETISWFPLAAVLYELLKFLRPIHVAPPSVDARISTRSSEPKFPGEVWPHVNTPKSNSTWKIKY